MKWPLECRRIPCMRIVGLRDGKTGEIKPFEVKAIEGQPVPDLIIFEEDLDEYYYVPEGMNP